MNSQENALQTVSAPTESQHFSANALMMNPEAMDRIMRMAEMMASGRCTIPTHLQKNPADCMAVVMQAMQWGMNPFAVAQKTHVTQGGALGYEAQLISAVICANAPVKEKAPKYEYIGDWSKLLGKVEERKSDKGGKYYVATYTRADEAGLGVICRLTLNGESAPREMTVMMSQCWPRFSTQWATDPKQQISYVAIRKWGRQYSPGTILGVYSPDEFEQAAPPRYMGQAEVVQPQVSPGLTDAADAAAEKGVQAYQNFWREIGQENRALLKHEHERLKAIAISADQNRTVETVRPAPAPAAQPAQQTTNATTGEISVNFEQMVEKLKKATTEDALYVAMDWAEAMTDKSQIKEIEQYFGERLAVIRGE